MLVCATSALAGPYSELIVFGDSLSDVGNIFEKTTSLSWLGIGPYPAPAYYDGRFSNGPVYAETLSESLGLGPLSHSNSGGDDYAHGNAMTSGTGFLLSFVIDDVNDQVDDYLANRTPSSDTLFVVFAGANDLIGGQTNVNVPVSNLISDISQLVNAGAQNILVGNLPLLGLTPRFNTSPSIAAAMNSLTTSFNSALDSALDTLEMSLSGVDLFRMDVAGLISNAVDNPAAFGMVNVTDSAAPGLTYDNDTYDPNLTVPNQDAYLFWDDLHPTTAAHALLAELALDAVTYSADFDFDGKVDELDLAVWEASYGVDAMADADGDGDSDGTDFLEWQNQFGSGVTAIAAAGTLVPEPSALLITMGLLVWTCGWRTCIRY